MTTRWRTLVLAMAVGLVPALGACERDVAEEEAADVPATAEETAAELRVTEVDLGRSLGPDGRVADAADTDDFGPNDTIYVSVDTDGAASGATLTARWTYEDGQVVDESSQTISPTGPSVTEFHISMPDGLPAGEYEVEILLDGRVVETEEFEVR